LIDYCVIQEVPKQDTRLAMKVASRFFIHLLASVDDQEVAGICAQLLDGVHHILIEASGETHILVRQ
jgi:hypothetical protein